jgi:hypothetical protein
MGQDPIGVTSYVILGPGAQPPATVETIGAAAPPSALAARQDSLSTYPAYNGSSVPSTTRTDFSSAQGNNGIMALVGGDEDGSVTFFSQADNTWVAAEQVLGDARQQVIQPSTTTSSSSSTTPTATGSSSPSATSAAANKDGGNGSRTWTILGGVLGGLCGLVAILIIILLCIRNKRREKKRAESKHKSYPAGKKGSSDFDFEDGMHPLRENGQPMGRSPHASQIGPPVIDTTRGSAAIFSARPNENLIRRISSDTRSIPDTQAATYGIFRRDKSPLAKSSLAISKPMNPHLGDYQERPSIDLGRATPASPTHPVNATPLVAIPSRNKSQRKTDEVWAKYFTGEKADPAAEYKQTSPPPAQQPTSPRHTRSRNGGSSGFWPGSGAPSAPVPPKFAFRDSAGNTLQTRSVGTSSPALENGPQEPSTRHYAAAAPKTGRISNANSLSSNGSEYDDEQLDPAFSSGIPASVQGGGHQRDTYSGGNWTVTGPNGQRVRSEYNPPPTAFTTNSSGGKSTSTGSSGLGATISNFPMPSGHTTPGGGGGVVREVQHPAAAHQRSTSRQGQTSGYFPPGVLHSEQDRNAGGVNTDVSWLNLGQGGNKSRKR